MYHCLLHLYLTGPDCPVFDRVRALEPLERFSHTFVDTPGEADAIFVNLEGQDVTAVLVELFRLKKPEAHLIPVVTREQTALLRPFYPQLETFWIMPMPQEELDFRLGRWQKGFKFQKDDWEVRQFLDATINASPNMIWYKTKDGIHEKVSDGFCKIVGKPREQAEGKDHCAIWDATPEEAEVCAQTDRKVMEGGVTVSAEEAVVSHGEQLLLTTYKSPLYDLDGTVMGTVGVGIDITKERAYREELLRKAHTMETIFTSLNCGVLFHTVDGSRVISVNQAALSILGYDTVDEMVGAGFKTVAQSVLDEDKPVLRAAIQSLTKAGESTEVEYRAVHKDGTVVNVLGNIQLMEENGELCYRRFLMDITSQKRQEQELQRRQEVLIQALGVDYTIVCRYDLKTGKGNPMRLALVDEDARQLGLQKEELDYQATLETFIRERVYPADQDMVRRFTARERLRRMLEERMVCYIDFRVLKNGEIRYYEIKAVRTGAWTEDQEIVFGIRNVDEATKNDLQQRQLLEDALAQANQASRAKTAFLSNMSHDIRTPMNAIVGFTDLAILHKDQPEKVEEYLGKIQASGNHLLRVLSDVLDMSAIESGKVQLSESSCSIPDTMAGLRDMVQVELQDRDLTLAVDTSGITDTQVFCDKLRLDQALLNILSNAIHYTKPGGSISLRVLQSPGAAPGFGDYVFFIKDTGIGMTPEFLDRIFEPFERERNSTASGVHGTGLGMAITKNIVELMNGKVKVDSIQGQGTTVTVSLSFRLDTTGGAAASPRPARTPSNLRLLLVEDNEMNREITLDILADAGFSADWAENGKAAVEKLTARGAGYYALVLMDIQMPVMDGYEATRAIRALSDPALAGIPIFALSANAFEEDRRKAMSCGMNGHIAKPINVEKLLGVIDEALK